MIKAVIFDIDGVLLDSFEANLKFFQDLMVKAGYPAPRRKTYLPLFYLPMMDAIKVLTQSDSEAEIKRIWEMGRSRTVPYPDELLAMPAGSAEVIEKLSQNYVLGVVTSRVKNSVYEGPELAQLEKYFTVTISYEDTVQHKPHPEPLLLAAQRLGVKPEECVYIGDAVSDIMAAQAAGMKVVIYSQDQFHGADAYIDSFAKLPELIASLNNVNNDKTIA